MKFLDNEDNHILVVSKPAGMLTQGNGREIGLEDQLRKKYRFIQCVHRLDRVTSGLVVFAKSSKALSRLNSSLRAGKWTKIYHARVEGLLSDCGRLEHKLIHGDHRAEVHCDGKQCVLDYRTLENGLVEVTLHTGRYHQIRAQFAAIGHPIVGDYKYGAKTPPSRCEGTIDLHHAHVVFPHPVQNKLLVFKDLKSM